VQQLCWGQDRPHPVERPASFVGTAQCVFDVTWANLGVTVRIGERGPELALDGTATGVVALEPATCVLDNSGCFAGPDTDVAGTERHLKVGTQRSLPIRDRIVDEITHAIFALELDGLATVARLVGPAELDARDQVSQHRLLDTGLAERRQDAFDVPQEHTVRPKDQHALVFERESMRVQKVCSAVQRNDSLAGARATLHDKHALLR
jgi:hypothetical protein